MGLGIGQQNTTGLGQMGPSAPLLEELDPNLLLEPGDRVADRRLRAIELFRRRCKAAQLHHGLQNLPFIERRLHSY